MSQPEVLSESRPPSGHSNTEMTEATTSYTIESEENKGSFRKQTKKAFKIVAKVASLVIAANAVQMGMCAGSDDIRICPLALCIATEQVFTLVFVAELIFKLYYHSTKVRAEQQKQHDGVTNARSYRSYFHHTDGWMYWHCLECAVALAAAIDAWLLTPVLDPQDYTGWHILTFFWLFRLLRFFRVFHLHSKLLHTVEGLTASMKGIGAVCILLAMMIYASSIFCVTCFETVTLEYPYTFDSVPRAMFALFSMCVLADWSEIVWPVVQRYKASVLFFYPFIVTTSFGILNLVIGVITKKVLMVREVYKKEKASKAQQEHMEHIKQIADRIFHSKKPVEQAFDGSKEEDDEVITKKEMESFVRKAVATGVETNKEGGLGEKLKNSIEDADLPVGYHIWDCHTMFDRDNTGDITKKEFVRGMERHIFSNDFQRSAMSHIAISDLKILIQEATDDIKEEIATLRRDFGLPPKVGGAAAAKKKEFLRASSTDTGNQVCDGTGSKEVGMQRQLSKSSAATIAGTFAQDNSLAACRQLLVRLQEPVALALADKVKELAPEILAAASATVAFGGAQHPVAQAPRGSTATELPPQASEGTATRGLSLNPACRGIRRLELPPQASEGGGGLHESGTKSAAGQPAAPKDAPSRADTKGSQAFVSDDEFVSV